MTLKLADRLAVVVIHSVNAVLILCRFGAQSCHSPKERFKLFAYLSVVRDILGNDVRRARKRVLGGRNALFSVNILCCKAFQIAVLQAL